MSDKIAVYTNPFLSYKCRLSTRGRPTYGTLSQFLATHQGVPSTVGTRSGNIYDATIRRSQHYSTNFQFDFLPTYVEQFLLLPVADENKRHHIRWLPDNHKYDVIVYEPGGYFREHEDARINRFHYGTLLIFPPAINEFAHTGGDLIITREDGSQFVFESSKVDYWTFLAFPPHYKHECLLVTSGKRVVIKTELCYLPHPVSEDNERFIPEICDVAPSPPPFPPPHDMILDRSIRH